MDLKFSPNVTIDSDTFLCFLTTALFYISIISGHRRAVKMIRDHYRSLQVITDYFKS